MKTQEEICPNRVEIRHTCILIHNYHRGENEYLERYFQVYDKGKFKFEDIAMYIDIKTHTLYIPSGIQLWLIYKHFKRDIWRKVKPDPFNKISQVRLKTSPRDDVQKEALSFCIGGEKYIENQKAHQLFLNLNTGKGKTYVMIATAAYFSVKTAIIMCSLDWIKQWKEKIFEYTDTQEKEIYIISGSHTINKLLKGLVDPNSIKFYLISHDTLRSYGDKYGWDKIRELFKYLKIGIKVYDEAHLYPINIFKIDYFTDVWKTYYLTATPMLSDPFKNIVFQRAYATVPKINLFKEDIDPHTDYLPIFFNSHPSALDLHDCQTNYGFNIIWYANYFVTKEVYYYILRIILDWVLERLSSQGKVLIYIGTNFGIQLTYYWLRYVLPFHSIGIFSSLVPKEEKRSQLDKQIILSTSKSAGAAVDIPNLEITIDLNEPSKSQVIVRQKLGRTRNWHTTFIDLIDIGFPQLRKYYELKRPIFKKYANNILNPVHLTDTEIHRRLIRIKEKQDAIWYQLQQRQNLKPVMEIKKPVLIFDNPKDNVPQY